MCVNSLTFALTDKQERSKTVEICNSLMLAFLIFFIILYRIGSMILIRSTTSYGIMLGKCILFWNRRRSDLRFKNKNNPFPAHTNFSFSTQILIQLAGHGCFPCSKVICLEQMPKG